MSTTLDATTKGTASKAKWLSLGILILAQLGTMLDISGFSVATEASEEPKAKEIRHTSPHAIANFANNLSNVFT